MIWNPPFISNIDVYSDPTSPFGTFVETLARQTQLVVWDKRGTGLSDPVARVPTLDERMDDLHAVLDDAEVDCPALVGASEGAPMSVLFAATYPERVRSLVLFGTAPRFSQDLPDFPCGFTPSQIAEQILDIETHWGEGALAEFFVGAAAELPGVLDLWARFQRMCASPTMARMTWQAVMEVDVREVLPAVRAPTLVMARVGDAIAPVESARAVAAGIPGAQFRMLPDGPHFCVDIPDLLTAEILDFVCQRRITSAGDRVLSTVLFTDIVSSTELLSAHGDERWRHQLDVHDNVVDNLLLKYGGQRAKHTGDGVFALFDGPTKAARCGLDLVPALATRGIRIRAGVHTGECERRGDEWSGMAVHVGARIGAMAGPGEVLTSRTVRDLSAGSELIFESLGPQQLKGLPEDIDVFRVTTPAGGRTR